MGGKAVSLNRRLAAAIIAALALPLLAAAQTPVAWAQVPVALTVNTQYAGGQSLTGLWTVLSQNGQTVATGFSPAQFQLASGQQYSVAVSNYGSAVFDHWSDNGSTNPVRAISISQATALTAVYRTATIALNPASGSIGTQVTVTGSNFPASSAVSLTYAGSAVATNPPSVTTSGTGGFSATFAVPSSSAPGQNTVRATAAGIFATATFTHGSSSNQQLTVNAQYTGGQALTGMWTVLSRDGQTTATGFTPVQFTLVSGQQYDLRVGNYGQTVFDHWLDTGSTSPTRSVSIAQATTLTAIYRNTGANQPPIANGQAVTVNENSQQTTITLAGSDPEGQPVKFFISNPPAHGVLGVINQNTITYRPYDYYDGPDSFSFVTNDGTLDSSPATVSLTVANTASKTTSQAVVITTELSGHTITGMTAYLYQGGTLINQGFTHIAFDVNNGQQYALTADNYQNYLFDHWLDTGSTSPTRTFSISQDTPIYAVYKTAVITLSPSTGVAGTVVTMTGDGFDISSAISLQYNGAAVSSTPPQLKTDATGAFTATFTVPSWSNSGANIVRATDAQGISAIATFTDTSNQPKQTLTINSQSTTGSAVTGFWTTLAQNGQTVATGFTPAQFQLASGQQYVATVSNYGQWTFDHWSDSGSTNPARTISITQATTITAIYRNTP